MEFHKNTRYIIDTQYEIIDKLRTGDKGQSSSIYLVKDIETERKYICKKFKNNSKFEKELKNYKIIHTNNPTSDNLIQFICSNEVHKDNIFNYIILEYAENGNLFNYIENQGGFDEIYCKLILEQVLFGLRDLHEVGLCHKNIKLTTILLGNNYKIKLSNFSLSDIISKKCQYKDKDNDIYKSPQALKGSFDGVKNDIYNLGIFLIELSTGKTNNPWNELYDKYFKPKNFVLFWKGVESQLNKSLSQDFKDLIMSMITFNQEERPTIDDILESAWMKEIKVEEKQRESLDNEFISELNKRKNKIIKMKENEIRNIVIDNTKNMPQQTCKTINNNTQIFFEKSVHKIKDTNDTYSLNDIIKIDKSIDPYDFMNRLCNKICNHFTNCSTKVSEKNLKFTVSIPEKAENIEDDFIKQFANLELKEEKKKEKKEDENQNEEEEEEENYILCVIEVKLFKYKNECYLIRIVRKSDDVYLYKKYLKIIDSFI